MLRHNQTIHTFHYQVKDSSNLFVDELSKEMTRLWGEGKIKDHKINYENPNYLHHSIQLYDTINFKHNLKEVEEIFNKLINSSKEK